ncbi:MAG: nucleotide pyrophosphohydrolase, partial [Epulopiscium sp.]|nr:nucleotide pyrophosphohydrolase [Candidatus Epulonipiscium sp.]
IGYDLETVLKMNIDKLRKRYPDGFEAERSLHREEKE